MENKNKTWLWIIIAVFIAILIFMLNRTPSQNKEQSIVIGDFPSITVGLQNPRSVAVLIHEVNLTAPGFVVIHKNNAGKPAEILAISDLLQPKNYKNISIVMDFSAGDTYFAMLHSDNGNGQFNLETDEPTTDPSGKIITTKFKISDTPFVEGEMDEKG